MLCTDKVAQPGNGSAGSAEIPELPFAIERDSVPIDMIVNMGLISMSTNKESVFPFEKAGGKIIADLVCFLRRNLSRLKRLADLINKHIVLFVFAGKVSILSFRY